MMNMSIKVRWLARLLLSLSLLAPLASGGSVYAQDYTIAGEWEITFDVLAGNVRAIWIGRVWQNENGVETMTAERVIDISSRCEIFGNPVFSEDEVTFDGVDDYITCQIPNFPVIFASMFPELTRCRCYYEGPPYAAADITPVYSTAEQPIVYHDRLYLEVVHNDKRTVRMPLIKTLASRLPWQGIRVDANNSLGLAKLTLQFFGGEIQTEQSNFFNVWQNNGFQIWAGYDAARYVKINSPDGFAKFLGDAGFWDAVETDFTEGLFFWESEALSKYVDEPMPSGFGLDHGTLIYFGHNPETQAFYEGTMRAAAIDPGCRGH
jgi:hypothetical protein